MNRIRKRKISKAQRRKLTSPTPQSFGKTHKNQGGVKPKMKREKGVWLPLKVEGAHAPYERNLKGKAFLAIIG